MNDLQKPFYSFSIDDVFDALIELTDTPREVFSHPFFSFLQSIHEQFGTNVDCYLFYQKKVGGKLRTLAEVTDKYAATLATNTWLRFGPHALDFETPPYQQSPEEFTATLSKIYQEINRFTGRASNAKLVRLHFFSAMYEVANYWRQQGVEYLFTRDQLEPASYRISDEANATLARQGLAAYEGLKFIRTNFRLEFAGPKKTLESPAEVIERYVKKSINDYGFFTFFTHDIEFLGDAKAKTEHYTRTILEYLTKNNIPSL
ncbi:hypothetical protein HY933_03145 [Candidatus Falkowbacteria bacterium]|nr:hypothetical protein [Candidatus Falkowbacteria bacterium]